MSETTELRIDLDAAKALIHWKSVFADEVSARAKNLAAASSQPDRVTQAHYRQAALMAVGSLAAVILEGAPPHGEQKAA